MMSSEGQPGGGAGRGGRVGQCITGKRRTIIEAGPGKKESAGDGLSGSYRILVDICRTGKESPRREGQKGCGIEVGKRRSPVG